MNNDDEKTAIVWITRYWATKGIYCTEATLGTYDSGVQFARVYWDYFRIGTDATLCRDEAVALVKKLAAAKIASLEKQLAKIRKLAGAPRFAVAKGDKKP